MDNDWQKDNEKFCKPIISCKAVTKILYGNYEKSSLECEKNSCANSFTSVLLLSNHTVFLVQFEINCTCEFFRKLKLHSPKRLVQFPLFEKLTRAN